MNREHVYHGGRLINIPKKLPQAIIDLKTRLNFTWDDIADRIEADENGIKPRGSTICSICLHPDRKATSGIVKGLSRMVNISSDVEPIAVAAKVDAYVETVQSTPLDAKRHEAEDCILEAVCAMSSRDVLFVARIARHIMARA